MLVYCTKACNTCHLNAHELDELIEKRLDENFEREEKARALQETKYGVEQDFVNDSSKETYDKMVEYMDKVVMVDPKYDSVRNDCKLRHEFCVYWAADGECENSREYMVVQCAPACLSCEQLNILERCPYDPNEPMALQPGDLNRLFETVVKREEYTTTILSQPNVASGDDMPWLISIDNFLTDAECDRLIELGRIKGYDQTADVGPQKWDGTFTWLSCLCLHIYSHSESGCDHNHSLTSVQGTYGHKFGTHLTSMNSWCQEECQFDPVVVAVTERMEDVTGIPSTNYEFFHLLRYEIGQYYKPHNDYLDHHQYRRQGPRALTMFLYLNTVEEGGGTNFPKLNNVTVMPKRGRALMWPSVLNEDPMRKDNRTDHQALPVLKGIKHSANAWIHVKDFRETFARACV